MAGKKATRADLQGSAPDSEKIPVGSAGLSAQLSQRWHLNADINCSEYGSTIASGGVAAFSATGPQYIYGGQLLGSSLLKAGDSMVFGIANPATAMRTPRLWRCVFHLATDYESIHDLLSPWKKIVAIWLAQRSNGLPIPCRALNTVCVEFSVSSFRRVVIMVFTGRHPMMAGRQKFTVLTPICGLDHIDQCDDRHKFAARTWDYVSPFVALHLLRIRFCTWAKGHEKQAIRAWQSTSS